MFQDPDDEIFATRPKRGRRLITSGHERCREKMDVFPEEGFPDEPRADQWEMGRCPGRPKPANLQPAE